MLWSACAVFTPLAMLAALYYRIARFEPSIPFAAAALLLAALFAFATEMLDKRAPRPGLAAAGAHLRDRRGRRAGARAHHRARAGLAHGRAGADGAGHRLGGGQAAAAGAALARRGGRRDRAGADRLGAAHRRRDIGTTPIFNWLLYGYGIPAAAFWLGGYLLRRRADDVPTRMIESGAILLTVLVVSLQIRHFIHADIYRASASLTELALQVCVGLAMMIGLEHVRRRTGSVVHDFGALIIAALTLAAIVLGLVLGAESAADRAAGRRPVHQPDPARLRHAGGAGRGAGAHLTRGAAAWLTARRRRWSRSRSRSAI